MLNSPYSPVRIRPPAEHPRLMLRQKDLPRIRRNIDSSFHPDATMLFRHLVGTEIYGVGATPEFGTYHLKEYLALEAKALDALLSEDTQKKRRVVELLFTLLRGARFEKGMMCARYSGHLIFITAEVYDWCYKEITPKEKQEMIARCETLAEAHFEMHYPPLRQSPISGHGTEAQLLRDLLAFSIAVYDERPDIYELCAGRLFDEYLPVYEEFFKAEFHTQGPCYGSYRYISSLWFGLLFLAMSGERVLPPVMERLPESFVYLTRSDGEALRLGDDYNETKAEYTAKNPFGVPLFLAAAYAGNRMYHDAARSQLCSPYLIPYHHGMDFYDEGSVGEGLISPSSLLIFEGLTPLKAGEERRKGRFFGFPVGCTVYNDGERLVLMKIGELWGANHDHLDTGCFQIYDNEILASDSGVYDSYHTPHRMQYAIRTLAHNCLLVNGQGTRVPLDGKEPKRLDAWTADYRMAKVLSHEESDDRYEIVGDLTEAYAENADRVIRRMCFEPNRGDRGILTVKDSVTPKSPDFPVTFLLHCQTEPILRGNEILIEGKERLLCCRVSASTEFTITAIGGKGKEFLADGVQYEPQVRTAECGWGRVEIQTVGNTEMTVEMEIFRKSESRISSHRVQQNPQEKHHDQYRKQQRNPH